MIALMVIAIGALLAYAFLPEDVAENLPLKQLSMEAIASRGEDKMAQQEADSLTEEPVDTAAQRVLLFGDSMSEYLAYRLADYANYNGHQLTCVTWVSSGTRNWAETDTLQHYIQMVNPTHVFVCLGSNELYTADMKGCERRIRAILEKIGDVPTVWIGPPNWCEDHGYYKLLLVVMGPKRYYPSYKLTFERQKDGRHPTMKSSAMWMDKIVEWMNEGHSIHPFRMEKPDKRNRHYKQFTILPPGTKHKTDSAARRDSLKSVREIEPGSDPMETLPAVPAEETANPAPPAKSAPAVKHVNHKDSI